MGFDYRKIPLLRHALEAGRWPLGTFLVADIVAQVNRERLGLSELSGSARRMRFEPAAGWKGHIESDEC